MGLDHVVLFVTAQTMLWAESRRDVEPAHSAQRVEGVLEVRGHGSRMCQQCHAPPFELAQQFDVAYQAVDAELDHLVGHSQSSSTTKLPA